MIPKNKKGNALGLIFFVALLFLILMLGFIFSTGWGVVNYALNETVPELINFGVTDGVNLTQIADKTIVPANNMFQNAGWLIGVLYVMILFGSIGFAVYSKFNPDRWLLGLYFLMMILLILGAILISNMYEDFYNGDDEFAPYLQSQGLMSFMIIQSPLVFTIIGFVTGIIIFSRLGEEGGTA